MKKAYYFLVVITAFIFGCANVELDENPPSLLSPDTFYTTESEFQAALVGSFKALYSDWVGFDYGDPLILTSGAEDVRSDAGIFINFDRLSPNGNDRGVKIVWEQLYKCIANTNALIGNLDNAKDITDQRLGEIEGQAKFLRAFSFFHLVRWWGEVQLTTFENQTDIKNLKQASVAEIYESIIQDLKRAEQTLPTSFSGEPGRPTQGAAKALLAKVYLTMAGWPIEDAANYALARDKAKEVMGMYSLEPNFADLWKNENKFNNEFIFTFYASIDNGGGFTGSHMHTASRHWGNGEDGWGDFYSEDRFFEAFPESPRKEATFTSTYADGTYWEDAGTQPHMAKYRDAGNTVGNNGEGFVVMLRYADVLLTFAEASNMAEGSPSTEALEAVNQIRRRAMGLDINTPDGGVDLPSGMSQTDFDSAVLDERNWELAFEFNRWFDLVRKKMVVEVNKDLHPNVTENNRLLPKPNAQLIPGFLEQNEGY
ncbi:RagB/SusD family nutrient uptake outer membrane protein [Algibacter agarivorans]|uniref:RagB/SusD family nutrient uptake outer membrane protein n=1 Tax=Algibacter agarivorans TaxID=1109741 RepID=A0ABP9GV99_9FLAO